MKPYIFQCHALKLNLFYIKIYIKDKGQFLGEIKRPRHIFSSITTLILVVDGSASVLAVAYSPNVFFINNKLVLHSQAAYFSLSME